MNQAGFAPLIDAPRRWNVIAGLMLEQGYTSFVEVGCKEGRTTGHILKTVPESTVVAIDPWVPMPQQKGVRGGETYEDWDFKKIEEKFWANVGEHKDRVEMLRTTSTDAASRWSKYRGREFPSAFDLVFIDAGHDYDSVIQDITLWGPLIRQGGMMVGHDFNHKWPSVERAVADSFDLMRVGVASDSVWFVIKHAEDTDPA